MTGHEPPPELKEDIHGIENRFSPGPADQRNQALLRHPERSIYRCFLTDLAGFTDICRVGPDYADRQDRKKTGLFRLHLTIACLQYPETANHKQRNTLILLLWVAIVKQNSRTHGYSKLC